MAEWVGLDVSQSRGPEFETHRAPFRILGKFVYQSLVISEKDRVNVKPKEEGGIVTSKRSQESKWLLVNNSSSATIRHMALHSLNHSRQVAALTNKISTFKNSTLASSPPHP